MLPTELTAAQFAKYPPEAQAIVTSQLSVLQKLPLAFLPLLLREAIAYDWKFPAERAELDHQLRHLSAMSAPELEKEMSGFTTLRLSPALEMLDWINNPGDFSEQLTAHLWATHQIDAFRSASVEYVHKLNESKPTEALPSNRLVMVTIGQGVAESKIPLFRKLRAQGVHFKNVDPSNGAAILLDEVASRGTKHPKPFAHWYIDGANTKSVPAETVTRLSYGSLDSVRLALVTQMTKAMQPGGGGPEFLRTMLARTNPADLGLTGSGDVGVLNKFKVSVLTEGAGTQLFSTTFVQWSSREALRRAQPLTLLARFTPRQREDSMKQLLAGTQHQPVPDPEGSLVDADMGAYYTWVNLQRLSAADTSSFLVWFEDHKEALAIGPSLPHGTENNDPVTLRAILNQLA